VVAAGRRVLGLQALLVRHRAQAEDSDLKHLRKAFLAEAAARGLLPAAPVAAPIPSPAPSAAPTHDFVAPGVAGDPPVSHVDDVDAGAGPHAAVLLPYHGVKAVMRRLNIYRDKRTMKGLFDKLDAGAAGALSFETFVELVDLLRDRPDILHVYTALLPPAATPADVGGAVEPPDAPPASTAGHVRVVKAEAFWRFLQRTQHESDCTLADAQRIMRHFDPLHDGHAISLPAFTAYLTSPGNSAFAPECGAVLHDMDQPLAHYYIDSSHNTYLEGDQFTSASSVSMYLTVLQKGCRCVELDCWDGPAGEPVVYHGHTLTSRIAFRDALVAMKPVAFASTAFPLILSLEIHCCKAQQDALADILVEVWGDALATPLQDGRPWAPAPTVLGGSGAGGSGVAGDGSEVVPEGERIHRRGSGRGGRWEALPSPRALAGKVLVKAKMVSKAVLPPELAAATATATSATRSGLPLSSSTKDVTIMPLSGGDGEGCAIGAPTGGGDKLQPALNATGGDGAAVAAAGGACVADASTCTTAATDAASTTAAVAAVATATVTVKHKYVLESDRLRGLVFLHTLKWVSPEHAASRERPWHMVSLKEPVAVRVVGGDPAAIVQHCSRQLIRVYPGPMRVDSSNFNPTPMWAAGVQMVALNYQTPDVPLRLNRALFRLNGRCGYVLKPRYMRGASTAAASSRAPSPLLAAAISTLAPPALAALPGDTARSGLASPAGPRLHSAMALHTAATARSPLAAGGTGASATSQTRRVAAPPRSRPPALSAGASPLALRTDGREPPHRHMADSLVGAADGVEQTAIAAPERTVQVAVVSHDETAGTELPSPEVALDVSPSQDVTDALPRPPSPTLSEGGPQPGDDGAADGATSSAVDGAGSSDAALGVPLSGSPQSDRGGFAGASLPASPVPSPPSPPSHPAVAHAFSQRVDSDWIADLFRAGRYDDAQRALHALMDEPHEAMAVAGEDVGKGGIAAVEVPVAPPATEAAPRAPPSPPVTRAVLASGTAEERGGGRPALAGASPAKVAVASLARSGTGATAASVDRWLRATASVSPHPYRSGSSSLPRSPGPSPLLLRPDVSPDACTLRVTVLGGQYLPKRVGDPDGDVPSPACSVIVYGVSGWSAPVPVGHAPTTPPPPLAGPAGH